MSVAGTPDVHLPSIDKDPTVVGSANTHKALNKSRLSSAILSEQSVKRAPRYRNAYVVQHSHRSKALGDMLGG
jgi:hypothetical protein